MVSGKSPETPFLDTLGIGRGDSVAIVGSGGKATLMYRLAGEAVDRGFAVITTSTTHLHPPTSRQTNGFFVTNETADWPVLIPRELEACRHVTVLGDRPRPDKLKGLEADELARLREVCALDLLLMKADGARARLFKAPGDYEPVVPEGTTRGVVVASLKSVGIRLDDRQVHRPERVGSLTGLGRDEPVTPEVIAAVVSHPEAYRRAFPISVPLSLYLSCAGDEESRALAVRIHQAVPGSVFEGIYCGDIQRSKAAVTRLA